ncbi:MAG: L,D-transpeptidase family protein [Candidatus Eisenbacteria bacterium]
MIDRTRFPLRLLRSAPLSALAVFLLPGGASAEISARSPEDALRDRLCFRVEAMAATAEPVAAGERVHAAETAVPFYRARGMGPAWVASGGGGTAAEELIRSIERAGEEGLRPGDYHLEALRDLLRRSEEAGPLGNEDLVDLDILLTDAWLLYGAHRVSGRVNPETIDAEWVAKRREVDLAAALEGALAAGRVAEALDDLLPDAPGYGRLREAFAKYRKIAASVDWDTVAAGEMIHPGDQGPRVLGMRFLLYKVGDLDTTAVPVPDLYDRGLAAAVRRFQARHGLDADGVVGPKTIEALNTPPSKRARQILLNLERWRWLPQDLGPRHLRVNIADFRLQAVENGRPVLDMAVIVGRDYRRTPVFTGTMTYLVLNPTWEVPHQLAVMDVLPEIRKDPSYVERLRFQVFAGWGGTDGPLDPDDIDWGALSRGSFPYRLRQLPGPANALGRVKFMFPNRFSVYLHDTPAKELFRKPERAFSSGCIRVERPLDLARYVLRGYPLGNETALETAIGTGEERTVKLPVPIPVHLLYWTAWVDEEGAEHFRRDIYGRDRLLDEALREDPPEPEDVPAGGGRESR